MSTTILTIASQKGGVGKTTTAVNLAATLSLAGKRTLLIDFDPQGNASSGVGSEQEGGDRSAATPKGVLALGLGGESLRPAVESTQIKDLHLIGSSPELSQLELIQELQEKGLPRFRKVVREVGKDFDFVILDCPPSLGGLPTIALGISDSVLIPIQCEYYAMEGLSQSLPVIKKVQSTTNSDLKILGLLLTMFSNDLELSHDVVREIVEYFPHLVFRTIVPRDVVLAEAASHGVPAFQYAPSSRGAWSYVELAKEVLAHDQP